MTEGSFSEFLMQLLKKNGVLLFVEQQTTTL